MITDPESLAHPLDPITAYLSGQHRASHGPLLEAFAAESAATLDAFHPTLDIPYGPHPRAIFDLYESKLPWRGTVAYLHAGYWQSRDKAQFRFLASAFLAQGLDLVLMNYPLCPDVTLDQLVGVVRDGIPRVLNVLRRKGRGGEQLVVAGHSAGAHLAVELALTNWRAHGARRSTIRGILPISGVYELTPLVATPLNDKLRLEPGQARLLSPLHRVDGSLPLAHFVVGALETPEFRAQTEAMHAAWVGGGGLSSMVVVDGADHFSVLRALKADGEMMQAVVRMVTAW